MVKWAEQPLVSRTEDKETTTWSQNSRGASHLGAVILNVFEHIHIKNGIERL
jgi:hypothetical protein